MLEQGRILGNYRIDGVLGQGGMGVVYEATQISLQRTVALKVMGADVSADNAFRERFRREGLIQAALDHPHIVTVYEAGEHERHLFIAMRMIRGPTLKDMIIGRELDAGRVLRVLGPIADALDAAHEAGLIHRDIKPQNILVGPRDHAFLADFGLTKFSGERGPTRTGQFVGSIDYIAPEQINGGDASVQTDLYALGAVLFEALTGVVPYPKGSDAAVLYAHMAEEPPRVSEQRPELPGALDAVIAAAMAKAPEARPATAAELLRDAERAFSRPTRAAMRLPGPVEGPQEAGVRPPEARVSTVQSDRPRAVAQAAVERPPALAAPAISEQREAAAPVARSTGRRRPTWPWLAGVPILLILGAAGYAGGRSGSSDSAGRTPAGFAQAGGVALDVPAGWARGTAPSLPGLKFADRLVVAPRAAGGHGLVAGMVPDAVGADLLPAALVGRLAGTAPTGEAVRLGDLQALRYRRLSIRGSDRIVTLYVVPTAAGSATVACYAPPQSPAPQVLRDCEGAATTLRVSGPSTYELGPSDAYGKRLSAVLASLDRDRATLRKSLGAAPKRAAQAAAARQLARITARAVSAARAIKVSARDREAHDQLVRGLAATRDAYARMATAAAAGRSSGFAAAVAGVRSGDAGVDTALAALGRLGYQT